MKINEELYNKWLNEKYVVATRTQEEYDQFMKWLEDNTDIKWYSRDKPSELSFWEKNEEKTCITYKHYRCPNGISYSTEEKNKLEGYQIIEFEELFTQDLRELLKVGYCIKLGSGRYEYITLEEQLQHLKYTRDKDLKYFLHVNNNDITSVYRPKYNGIKSIGKPEWELVWERKEELYTLQTPITGHYLCKTENGINLRHKNDKYNGVRHNENRGENAITFTKKEIDNLPNQDFIKTLDKKLYEETK